ncbi:MAG: 4-alpha-glucanotransferase [Opitutaceae bacterium]
MTAPAPLHRTAGLLVPVFALRHAADLGIGDTRAVREAVDFCAQQRLAVLQLLPIHETVGDHSPYNPISARALEPAYLALEPGAVPGLTAEMLEAAAPTAWVAQLRSGKVKHNSVHALKLQILLAAHRAFTAQPGDEALVAEFQRFREQQEDWLRPYTLFRLLVREYEGNPNWAEWRPEHQTLATAEAWFARHPDQAQLARVREGLAFVQWVAWRQWNALREHASAKGVRLMGEMSYGVGRCSVDVWANPDLFDFEWYVGTGPIAYFDTNKDSERWGQNWGLPPYRWENHRSTGFAWLRGRVAGERQFFHICRLDHLRGYFRAHMFPWPGGVIHTEFATLTAEQAKLRTGGRLPRYVPGPDEDPVTARMNDLQGRELIGVVQQAAGDMELFAELMGDMPDYMRRALDDLHLANLTFPQMERNADRTLRPPETFRALSLATYATHDHAPIAAVYAGLLEDAAKDPGGVAATDLKELLAFAGWTAAPPPTLTDELHAALVRALFATPCELAVLLSSDLLGIPQRFNLPGTYGAGTWAERLEFPLPEFRAHGVYGRRLEHVSQLVDETGRAP